VRVPLALVSCLLLRLEINMLLCLNLGQIMLNIVQSYINTNFTSRFAILMFVKLPLSMALINYMTTV